MTRIRCPDPAWILVPIERQGIGAKILAPKRRPEILLQTLRLAAQPDFEIILAHAMREFRGMRLGPEHVALHFAKRDRPFGQRAIGVENRIIRILPALIDKARRVLPRIFDKAVSIRVAERVDPLQSRVDIRPDRGDRFDIPGPVEIHASQHDIERRGIDGAVIEPERHFAQTRHFPVPGFMQDLAWLRAGDGGADVRRV